MPKIKRKKKYIFKRTSKASSSKPGEKKCYSLIVKCLRDGIRQLRYQYSFYAVAACLREGEGLWEINIPLVAFILHPKKIYEYYIDKCSYDVHGKSFGGRIVPKK